MKNRFFVMMWSQDGETATPITESDKYGNDIVAFWETEKEARKDMDKHPFASANGYEVFEM